MRTTLKVQWSLKGLGDVLNSTACLAFIRKRSEGGVRGGEGRRINVKFDIYV